MYSFEQNKKKKLIFDKVALRGHRNDTGMTFIPQFIHEFHSRVKFVLHSHDKIKWLGL